MTRESFIPSDLDLDFKSQRHGGPAPAPANEGNVHAGICPFVSLDGRQLSKLDALWLINPIAVEP